MRGFRLFGKNSDSFHDLNGEQGYLLVGAGALILLIVGLLSSYIFTVQRDSHYKAFYAAGERFAETIAAAHFYAQQQVYDTGAPGTVAANCNLLTEMNLPDGLAMNPIGGTTFAMQICGADLAPVNATTPIVIKAASAYVQLKIRGRQPSNTDRIAFLAGAASRGMDRASFAGVNVTGNCDTPATPAIFRWGPDVSACLTSANLGALGFNDVVDGDIVVPAWETALAVTEVSVIFRYPQPERPDLNSMTTNLEFENPALPAGPVDCNGNVAGATINCFNGIGELRTVENDPATPDIDAPGFVTVGSAGTPGSVVVRTGDVTNLNGPVTTNGAPMRVTDDAGVHGPNTMEVAGPVTLTGSATTLINIGGTMETIPGGNLDVVTVDPIYTNTMEPKPGSLTTEVEADAGGPPGSFVIDTVTSTGIDDVAMTKNGGQLNMTGYLGAANATTTLQNNAGQQLDVFAARMTTNNTARATNGNSPNDLAWTVQTIDQRGSTADYNLNTSKVLRVHNITVNQNCIGKACPDSVDDTPPDGGL